MKRKKSTRAKRVRFRFVDSIVRLCSFLFGIYPETGFCVFRYVRGPDPVAVPAMNLNPRHTALLDEVRAHGPQTIEALSERFGVTLQTVRRDVQRLAEAGLLARFHGGVRLPSSTTENIAYRQRQAMQADAKTRIARAVARRTRSSA